MKWNKTIASSCRWANVVSDVLDTNNMEIIWEDSLQDYQGYADFVGIRPNGEIVHYAWTYGSCTGCDSWEERLKTEVAEEIKNTASVLDRNNFRNYGPFIVKKEVMKLLEARFPDIVPSKKRFARIQYD